MNGLPTNVCPTSTVVGAAIINMIQAEVVERLGAMGIVPPVFVSANVDGGDEIDRQWRGAFEKRA